MGSAKDLDAAKAEFKRHGKPLKARTTPEQLAAAAYTGRTAAYGNTSSKATRRSRSGQRQSDDAFPRLPDRQQIKVAQARSG